MGGKELKCLPVAWYDSLAVILDGVDLDGEWPDGVLDAYSAMIPKADGDATSLGQFPLCVLLVVYSFWASARLGQLAEWLRSWVLDCVFCAGGGCSSVEAWYSTPLDIEEVLSRLLILMFISSLMMSSNPLIRLIGACLTESSAVLGCLVGLRMRTFGIMPVLEFGLSSRPAFGKPGSERRGTPQGCPLSMIFIVALHLPWCRVLESVPGVIPRLYADNLKCVSFCPEALCSAARFTNLFIELVGQKAAPKKCVLISTSKKVGEDMRDWFISGGGHWWTIKLDVRDLGHLDATFWSRNAALARRAVGMLDKVRAVGALPQGFGGKLRILRAMHTLAALHGFEASAISQASSKRLRAAHVRAVTSGTMHLANPGAVLSLQDGPTGCDHGCHDVWCRFRMLRRYMA